MSASSVLVASCTESFEPVKLVKEILEVDQLPESTNPLEGIQAYPWHVDTKYYTVDVQLCTTDSRTIGNKDFAESVEAVLVYFNGNDKASFNQVKSWIPFIKEIGPEVRMLVCERSLPSHVIPRDFVQEWCLDYNFELVELDPEKDDNDDVEDDFPDSFGTKRIIQALHAHTWPNMVMKEQPNIRSPYFQKLMKEQAAEQAKEIQERLGQSSPATKPDESTSCAAMPSEVTPNGTDHFININTDCKEGGDTSEGKAAAATAADDDDDSKEKSSKLKEKNKNDVIDSMLSAEDAAVFEALANDDGDEDTFEKLFSQLKTMKEKSDMMPQEQRKAYAEQMAISFWRAVGGDEEEIANLSGSSDD